LEEIVTLRIEAEHKAALEERAKAHGLNLSAYCRMVLYKHLEETK
jgi:predicted DNA binding CopG/RHH family protein